MIPQKEVEGWIEDACCDGKQPSPLAGNRKGRRAAASILKRAVRQLKKRAAKPAKPIATVLANWCDGLDGWAE
jgi:hypothetical protein